jgi:predicted metal-dependent phosphoesterase TrpH
VDRGSADGAAARAFLDLHVHTSASFDSLATPAAVVRAAAARGLTHLAITDHDGIEGARAAQRIAEAEVPALRVIVGEEIKTLSGDLIAVFLERPIASGLATVDAIAEVRAQGGLVGIPHPFDSFRGSVLVDEAMASIAPLVDWVETHNARIMVGNGNERAALFARENELPGVAVSDAHAVMEIGVAYVALDGDPSTPDGLLAALPSAELIAGRATVFVRAVTPVAKLVQRARGRGRVSSPR